MRYALYAIDPDVKGDLVLVSTDPHEAYPGIPLCVGDAADIFRAVGRHVAHQGDTAVVPQRAILRELAAAVDEIHD